MSTTEKQDKPATNGSTPAEPEALDLATITPARRLVKLPTKRTPTGEPFELRLLDDFGIADQQQLLSWSRRFDALWNSEEDLTDDQRLTLKFLLDSIVDRVLEAPKQVKKDLPDSMRARVVTAFTLAPLLAQQEAMRKAEAEAEETETESEATATSTSES